MVPADLVFSINSFKTWLETAAAPVAANLRLLTASSVTKGERAIKVISGGTKNKYDGCHIFVELNLREFETSPAHYFVLGKRCGESLWLKLWQCDQLVAPAEAHAQKRHCPIDVEKRQQPNS
jgi:hypothetical protein